MKRLTILAAALLALGLAAACGSSSDSSTPPAGFTQPAGTVPVNFRVKDSTGLFAAGSLKWKGSMLYDGSDATRKISYDSTWSGGTARAGFPTLYDDGPWNAGGHEPAGATAGDKIWGVTVFVTPPATGSQVYEFGLIDEDYERLYGNGWIWRGSNGTFTVAAGATAAIDAVASPFEILPFGTTDMELEIDATVVPTTVTHMKVKGSAWAWGESILLDDGLKGDATAGDKKYTFRLSEWVGAGKPFFHTGLLKSGDKPEFIFVYNGTATAGTGKEYKNINGVAEVAGVKARVKAQGSTTWDPVAVTTIANKNTAITVP